MNTFVTFWIFFFMVFYFSFLGFVKPRRAERALGHYEKKAYLEGTECSMWCSQGRKKTLHVEELIHRSKSVSNR